MVVDRALGGAEQGARRSARTMPSPVRSPPAIQQQETNQEPLECIRDRKRGAGQPQTAFLAVALRAQTAICP